jgi:hypothetical protein
MVGLPIESHAQGFEGRLVPQAQRPVGLQNRLGLPEAEADAAIVAHIDEIMRVQRVDLGLLRIRFWRAAAETKDDAGIECATLDCVRDDGLEPERCVDECLLVRAGKGEMST